jgi:hypothetical protein
MICRDQITRKLNTLGFTPLALPRSKIAPLDLYHRGGGRLHSLGRLEDVFLTMNVVTPTVEHAKAPTISGQSTGKLSLNLGLDMLDRVVTAMGGSSAGLQASYASAKRVAFEFQDVVTEYVAVAQLDAFLSDTDVRPGVKHTRDLLDQEDVFIVTATLKTKKLVVTSFSSDETELALDPGSLQNIVGADISVKGMAERSSRLAYEGKRQLAFAIQTIRLGYEEGSYRSFIIDAPRRYAVASGASDWVDQYSDIPNLKELGRLELLTSGLAQVAEPD